MTTNIQTMTQAISYVRYSSKIQAEGDSDRRQNERVQQWLDTHAGFNLVHEYSDEGLSAFKGEHLAEGSDLYNLLEDCKRGIYQPGAVLLVEAFDRLSRGGIDATQEIVKAILKTDVRIVILQDNPDKFYDRSALNDAFAVITIAIKAQAAWEESEKKQKRGLINWSQKRLLASQGKIMTRACPAWLEVNEERTAFNPVEPHLSTVRRIFKMRLAGESMAGIAKTLNNDGVQNFKPELIKDADGKTIDRRPQFGKWNQTTIQQLLLNPAVFGRKVVSKQATDAVKESAEPIDNYYVWGADRQVAVSLHDYMEVQKIVGKWGQGRAQANDDPRLVNVFKTVLVCAHCGASIIQSSIKPNDPKYYTYGYYVCSLKRQGRCDDSKPMRRDLVESAIIQGLLYNTERLLSGTKVNEKELQQMEAEHEQIQEQQNMLLDVLLAGRIKKEQYNTRYDALTASLDQLALQIEQHRQLTKTDFPSSLVRNIDLTDKAQRFELQRIVQRYVTAIRMNGVNKTANIELKSGYVLNGYPLDRIIDGDKWIEYLHVMGLREYTFNGLEAETVPAHIMLEHAAEWVHKAIEDDSRRQPVPESEVDYH